jgi:hypothetical protein
LTLDDEKMIVFDPLGELQEIVKDIRESEKEE